MYHSLKFSSQLGWVAQYLEVCKAAAKNAGSCSLLGFPAATPPLSDRWHHFVRSERRVRRTNPVTGLTHCAQGPFESQLHTQSLLSCCHMALIVIKFDMV